MINQADPRKQRPTSPRSTRGTITLVLINTGTPNAEALQAIMDSLTYETECSGLPGFQVLDMTIGNAIKQPFIKELS